MKRDNKKHIIYPMLILVLICIVAGFAMGCAKIYGTKTTYTPGEEWIADMRGRVEVAIDDHEKKTQMMILVDEMGIGILELDRIMREHYSILFKIDRNYNSTPEEFRKEFADFNKKRYQIRDKITDANFQIRTLATGEEWEKLTDIKKKKGLFKESMQYPELG